MKSAKGHCSSTGDSVGGFAVFAKIHKLLERSSAILGFKEEHREAQIHRKAVLNFQSFICKMKSDFQIYHWNLNLLQQPFFPGA